MSGYQFVPLPRDVRRAARPTLERRLDGHLFGAITVTFLLEQPLHVGSGYKGLDGKQLVRTAARSGGALVVPGSSARGAIRARFEASTRSCGLGQPKNQRNVVSQSYPQAKFAELTRAATDHPAFSACKRGQLCPTCGLFGYQNGRGRVSVGDFAPVEAVAALQAGIAPQFSPRLHHCGDFEVREDTFFVRTLHGRKFYAGRGVEAPGAKQQIEVMPAGARIRGTLQLFNVSPAEAGGLLSALGLEPGSFMKLGAGKNLGFGRVRPVEVSWNLRDARRREVAPNPPAWRAAFVTNNDDYWADGENALVAMYRRGDV